MPTDKRYAWTCVGESATAFGYTINISLKDIPGYNCAITPHELILSAGYTTLERTTD